MLRNSVPMDLCSVIRLLLLGKKHIRVPLSVFFGEDYADEEKRRFLSLEFNVTKDTPPTFMWHTAPDDTVPVENSLLFSRLFMRWTFRQNYISIL